MAVPLLVVIEITVATALGVSKVTGNDIMPPSTIVAAPMVTVGQLEIVIVTLVTAFGHPPFPATVYKMFTEPAPTRVTKPVALTVATAVFDEDHVPAAELPEIDN